EAHPLALAAGELRGIALREPLELHEPQQLADALPDLRARHLADLEAERDILLDRHVLERRVVLEDEPDPALLRAAAGHLLLRDVDRARIRALEAGDAAQQRRLAGA